MPSPPEVGLPNLGNTCFLNSIIQALGSCSSIKLYLQDIVDNQNRSSSKKNTHDLNLSKSLFSRSIDTLARSFAQIYLFSLIGIKGDEAWRSNEPPSEEKCKSVAWERQQRYLSECSVSKSLLNLVTLLLDPSSSSSSSSSPSHRLLKHPQSLIDASSTPIQKARDIPAALRDFVKCLTHRAKNGDETEGDPLFDHDGEQQDAMEALEMLCNAVCDEAQAWEGLVGRWILDRNLELADLESDPNAQLSRSKGMNQSATLKCERMVVGDSDDESSTNELIINDSNSNNVDEESSTDGSKNTTTTTTSATNLETSRNSHTPKAAVLAAAATMDSLRFLLSHNEIQNDSSPSPCRRGSALFTCRPSPPSTTTTTATATATATATTTATATATTTTTTTTAPSSSIATSVPSTSSSRPLLPSPPPSNRTPGCASNHPLRGQVSSTLVCCTCGNRSTVQIQPFWAQSVSLPSPRPSPSFRLPRGGGGSSGGGGGGGGGRSSKKNDDDDKDGRQHRINGGITLSDCLANTFCSEILQEVTCAKCTLKSAAFELENRIAYPDEFSAPSEGGDEEEEEDNEGEKGKEKIRAKKDLKRKKGTIRDAQQAIALARLRHTMPIPDLEVADELDSLNLCRMSYKAARRMVRLTWLSRTPHVFCIHLQRIVWPSYGGAPMKDGRFVQFPLDLDVRQFRHHEFFDQVSEQNPNHGIHRGNGGDLGGGEGYGGGFTGLSGLGISNSYNNISNSYSGGGGSPFGAAAAVANAWNGIHVMAKPRPCSSRMDSKEEGEEGKEEGKEGGKKEGKEEKGQGMAKEKEEGNGRKEILGVEVEGGNVLHLKAVVVHLGTHSSFGHYVVYRRWGANGSSTMTKEGRTTAADRNPKRTNLDLSRWIRISDDAVSWASEAEVLSQVASLLFYERTP